MFNNDQSLIDQGSGLLNNNDTIVKAGKGIIILPM